MRKLTFIFFILLLGGAYTFYWFKKADDFKVIIEQAIAEQNAQARQYNKNITLIRYDSIAISGYPVGMQLNFINPVFDIPLTPLLEDYSGQEATQASALNAAKPDIVLEMSYNGTVALASNLEANAFTLTLPEDATVKPIINNEARKALKETSSLPVVCHLGISNPDSLPWNVPQSFTDMNAFFAAFRSMDCGVSGQTTKYADSGETLSSTDEFSVKVTSTPVDEENHKSSFAVTLKNSKTLPDFDALLNSYLPLVYDVLDIPVDQRTVQIDMAQYGAQNANIDISYEGPVDKKSVLDPSLNATFDVSALDFKNDLYDTSNKLHFSTAVHGNTRESALTANLNLDASEKYEQLLKTKLSEILAEIAKNPSPDIKFSSDIAALGKPDDLAAAIIPKLHTIGKITFDADINVSGDKDKNILDTGDFTINALNLTASQYGLKMKGSGKTNTSSMLPVGDLLATCILCDDMLNNIGDYAINIDSLLASTRPGQMHYVTKPMVEGIKQFLHAINANTDKSSKDIMIHFVADDKGMITISGKQLLEVIGLFGVNIGQSLQPSSQEQPTVPAAPSKAKAKPAK